tara:strand:- start:10104 stop:11384 length:1281 start_codon:yes stop_codon:yes gene_type:complete
MKLSYLAFKNMVSKPLNLLLSLLLLSLSVFLVTFTLQFGQQVDRQLSKNIAPVDMTVGAKGSPLQLVLSSVLHADAPTGNINYKDIVFLQNHPFVKTSIPISYGDNYKGFRILGTEADYLELYNTQLSEGFVFKRPFEVVAGANVVKRLGLKIGDSFVSSHGLANSSIETHKEHPFTIKGILKSTGTVVDNLLITGLESIWLVHDHDEEQKYSEANLNHEEHDEHDHDDEHHNHDGEEIHAEQNENKEITSLLVKFKNPLGMVQLPRSINENTTLQAALPSFEIQRLERLLGSGEQTVLGIALIILIVSSISIFISILKNIRERKQELALLRIYGLGTWQLLRLALFEGFYLAFIGFVLGWFFSRFGIWVVSQYVQKLNGYGFEIYPPDIIELQLLGIILVIAFVAALIASRSTFQLNIAKTLSNA